MTERRRLMKTRIPGDPALCRSCGARIVWVRLESGKRCPLDIEPKRGYLMTGDVPELIEIYETHFTTCPQADQHRKPHRAEIGETDEPTT